jgi:Uncharacterised protein family (UPF0175)
MTIHLDIPEDIAQYLTADGKDISRVALELMLAEAYREEKLTNEQIRRLLGFQTRMELDGFLKEHQVWLEYTMEDFEREAGIIENLQQKRKDELAREAAQEHRRAG